MSDRQELIDWLRHWKHEVPTTREREEMIEAMRDAATALEEAQGVPTHTRDWTEDASHENGRYQNQCVSCGEFFMGHKRRVACKLCVAAHSDAAPAAPTREPEPFPDSRFGLTDAERSAALAAWNACANDETLRQEITHIALCMYAVFAAGKGAREPDEQDAKRYRYLRRNQCWPDRELDRLRDEGSNATNAELLDAAIDNILAEQER